MRNSLMWMLALYLLFASPAHGQNPAMPVISSVEPQSGKAGEMLTARGSNLGPDDVAVLYLTDGNSDLKVEMAEQASDSIRFKIPADAKPGRYSLMVLTRGNSPRLIEEPVKVNVEAATTGS